MLECRLCAGPSAHLDERHLVEEAVASGGGEIHEAHTGRARQRRLQTPDLVDHLEARAQLLHRLQNAEQWKRSQVVSSRDADAVPRWCCI